MTPEESAVTHLLAQRAHGRCTLEEGCITLSWKGLPMERRNGPYRIAKAKE